METTTVREHRYPAQALTRLTDEVDRLSSKIDRLSETMATKNDLARYAPRETVETRWAEFERRLGELHGQVEHHETQIATFLHEGFSREMRWDWRVIGALGCILSFIFGLLGTILSGTLVGIIVWNLTH
ncbi:MAG: hypothetical protein H0U76_09070 [Ktedonobacteraceae bacterium]|nr:hypothetical protein [Ktedonobacteraceae bacterium]MBA3826189.1 hypothetical protein [Ktedonobacterales bacterium]